MTKTYPWFRFWVEDNAPITLDFDSYLPDPETYGRFFNEPVLSFSDVLKRRCSIMLGEPGMGKSKSLELDVERINRRAHGADQACHFMDLLTVTSLLDLREQIADSVTIRNWIAGDYTLHLCLDSLDDALPFYPGIAKALLDMLRTFPRDRLHFSIACRTGEVPGYFDEGLAKLFGANEVSRWYLAPLTQADIRLAAAHEGVDPDSFMAMVSERGAQPLAARPVTLTLLLRLAGSGAELPADIWSLYEQGCRALLTEHPNSTRTTAQYRLDVMQRMALAGRAACITILGAYTAITTDPNATAADGIIASTEIAGGQEIAAANPFTVNNREVSEVLHSSLFVADGSRYRWCHKSFVEFLTAYHLRSNAVTQKQVLNLLNCCGRIAPALRGIAAWLAYKEEALRQEILQIDPEVILFSDLSMISDGQKKELVDWLLHQASSESPLVHEWGMFWNYRKLKHRGLKEQLEPVIRLSTSNTARACAIEIAHACHEGGLARLLVDVALRNDEPIALRMAAVLCVADCADEGQRARLVPLALKVRSNGDQNDPHERLAAAALGAIWPAHCTWSQISDSLGANDASTTTSLGRFIAFDLIGKLPDSDMTAALEWAAKSNWSLSPLSAWGAATDALLDQAIVKWRDKAVRNAICNVLNKRLTAHYGMFCKSDRTASNKSLPWPVDARRAIASELFSQLTSDPTSAVSALRHPNPLLTPDDLRFAIEQYEMASDEAKRVWQIAIAQLVSWHDGALVSSALAQTVRYPGLHKSLLDIEENSRRTLASDTEIERSQQAKSLQQREERVERIRELLGLAATDTNAFCNLLLTMSCKLEEDHTVGVLSRRIPEFPGWQVLSQEEQLTLLGAGRFFIENVNPTTFRDLRHGNPSWLSASGYAIMRELMTVQRDYLYALPAHVWERWASSILLCQCQIPDGQFFPTDERLLKLAADRAEAYLRRTFAIIVSRARTPAIEVQLRRVATVLHSEDFDDAVFKSINRSRLSRGVMSVTIYVAGMRMLVRRGHAEAMRTVSGAAMAVSNANADEMERLAVNAGLWLEVTGEEGWGTIWEQMRRVPPFALALLNARTQDGTLIADIVGWLGDRDLRDLFLWLRKQFGAPPVFPSLSGQPQWVAQHAAIDALRRRGSANGIAVLEEIEQAILSEDDPGKVQTLWEVRKAASDCNRTLTETSWSPLDATVVKRLIQDKRQLLVRDESELLEAVWQALSDYQEAVRGEGSRVMRLWNEPRFTPKGEVHISREIAHELQDILYLRGIKVTREVKIREDQIVDIYLSAVTADSRKRIVSMIIEVKGCWHAELKEAQETQLAMKYLKDNLSKQGIYLVVWFLCDKWSKQDQRRRKTPKQAPAELRSFLDRQSAGVNDATGSAIRPFVLDATIEGTARKSVARKRGRKTAGRATA